MGLETHEHSVILKIILVLEIILALKHLQSSLWVQSWFTSEARMTEFSLSKKIWTNYFFTEKKKILIKKCRVYIMGKKKRWRAWTPGRFCEVASHGKAFSFFSVFLKKISINCRFFTQKEHLPAQKKETFCMKKITSYLLRFCKTNSRPLLKKNTYLLQKKEVLIEKLKTVLPAVILKKKSWPPTSPYF